MSAVLPRRWFATLLACGLICSGMVHQGSGAEVPDAGRSDAARSLSPEESLATIRTRPGLIAELVVSEPLIASPVAIDFGPDGKLWVVEMYDYPQGLDGAYRPGGRVRFLESTQGDGRFDKSTIFLDGIPLPTGVLVWRKGVLICSAPDILFAEDSDGDGRADVVRKLFSGFGSRNPQARVNSLEYGLDGWVYGSCGLAGGRISSYAGGEPLKLSDRDFRMRPDTGQIEAASGRTQQGRTRDDWGNWFGCDNETLLLHYPLLDQYLRRNPHAALADDAVYVPAGADASRLFPLNPGLQLFKLTGPSGRPTAVCGLGVYRDDLLGPEFTGNVFMCEAVNLLVHRRTLTPKGSSFEGHRAVDETQSEFLAASDTWFRPVQARTGPDGGLWIVDMHRLVIEHPRFIPPTELARLDVRAGQDQGRIFRVSARELRRWPRLDQLDAAGLVAALDSPNGWQRDLATQMLLWRGDKAAVGPLETLAAKSERPLARLHALCALDGLKELKAEAVLAALRDAHAGVRRHAIRLAEQFLNDSRVAAELPRLAQDEDPQVRLQLACSLGQMKSAGADSTGGQALVALALRAEDEFQFAAVLSSLNAENVASIVTGILRALPGRDFRESFLRQLTSVAVVLRGDRALAGILTEVAVPSQGPVSIGQWAAAVGAIEGLERSGRPLGERADDESGRVLRRLVGEARRSAADDQTPEAQRIAAMALLGRDAGQCGDDLAALGELLTARQPAAVQQAAVAALGRIRDERAATLALDNWNGRSPSLKGQLLDLLLGRPEGAALLLKQVADGGVPARDVDPARRQHLLRHKQPEIREQAAKLLAGATNPDRGAVMAKYRAALDLVGDPVHGKAVFSKTCSVCHRLEEAGYSIGPDLAALANKSPQSLLQEILDPNRNLDSRYVVYSASTSAGRTYTGLLAAETAASITLRGQETKQDVLLRSDIDELIGTGLSLMPEGLEKDLSFQDVADLLAYLTSFGPAPKQFPGNRPRTVRPSGGTLALLAGDAAIFGDGIIYEEVTRNVSQWRSIRDHLVWTVELAAAADFDVWLDWACDDFHSGNPFTLYGGDPAVRGNVANSGSFYTYRQEKIGTTRLEAGLHRLTLQPEGEKIHRALMDLRAIYLVPPGERPQLALADPQNAAPDDLMAAARQVLNPRHSDDERKAIIQKHLDQAGRLVTLMTTDLKAGTPEEYVRIPWIWRVAIAAGKENKTAVLRDLLDVSLPKLDQPLLDWQAVVIGGGIINGFSQLKLWPRERIAELLKGDEGLTKRWERLLVQSAEMADNEKVPTGTRYDALRIIPLDTWERRGAQLQKYLARGIHEELQMGAISGISDVDRPQSAELLLSCLPYVNEENRGIALRALLRTDQRVDALLNAIERKQLDPATLEGALRKALLEHNDEKLRTRAAKLLK